jgi:hypothetical protein
MVRRPLNEDSNKQLKIRESVGEEKIFDISFSY